MTFWLRDLGSQYKVEKTEEYIPWGSDNSYAEMIRVRKSRDNPPIFQVPSHLYKYSETELGLYLKDRKNLWRPLGRILNERIDISDAELMIHFPIARFADIARIVPFVRKRGNGIQSEAFKEARRLVQFRAKNGGKRGQNDPNLKDNELSNVITRLDSFNGRDPI
jgi:hypothetical protein